MENRQNLGSDIPPTLNIYGNMCALSAFYDRNKEGYLTVTLETAVKIAGSSNFDWSKKQQNQLMEEEIPMICSVLLGWTPMVEFQNRGSAKNKSVKFVHQGTNIFLETNEGGAKDSAGLRRLPIIPSDTFRLALFMLNRYAQNYPYLDTSLMLETLRLTMGRMLHQQNANQRT